MEKIFNVVGIILQCIMTLIILDDIIQISNYKKSIFTKIACIVGNLLLWLTIEPISDYAKVCVVFIDIAGYLLYLIYLPRQKFSEIFAAVMVVNIVNALCGVCLAIIITLLNYVLPFLNGYTLLVLILSYLFRAYLLWKIWLVGKRFHLHKTMQDKRGRFVVIFLGILFQFPRISIHIMHHNVKSIQLYVALTILIMGSIFGGLWLIDWYLNEKEKRVLFDDNLRMSREIHKSKEIMPVIYHALHNLSAAEEKAEGYALSSIQQLWKEQMGEHKQQNLLCKIYPETGLALLDEQLKIYGNETAQKGIELDVFVNESVKIILRDEKIKELDYLQLIGDLMRNAIRAIERKHNYDGRILLIVGYVADIFQTEICDNGAMFPQHILSEFGKRGNTEGGTGHGLADMLEIIEKYQASYQLAEYEDTGGFTKGITITWDSLNRRVLNSKRKELLIEHSIWK